MNRDPRFCCHRNRIRAFTLIELLVVVSIIATLAAILLPSISMVRASSEKTACQSNLRQLGMAGSLYTEDWDGMYPAWNISFAWPWVTMEWLQQYWQYTDACPSNTKVIDCPTYRSRYGMAANRTSNFGAFRLNLPALLCAGGGLGGKSYDPGWAPRASDIKAPLSQIFLLGEGSGLLGPIEAVGLHPETGTFSSWMLGQKDTIDHRHQGGNNFVFYDGHVAYAKSAPDPNPPEETWWHW